ncbi:MAG: HD domain-containing protein [Oscillospiraceae bacterium]|nr:HD domain-containing protein [Oscillospiraceae bacterium]
MDRKIGKINRNLVIGWSIIVVILVVAYFIEYLKGDRTLGYILVFFAVTIIPAVGCVIGYARNRESVKLRYYAIGGYTIMYLFALMTSTTVMVYAYIIPMLSLIVLYHSPKLVMVMGSISIVANVIAAIRFLVDGIVEKHDIRTIEIQFAIIIVSFVFAFLSSMIYDEIVKENEKYLSGINEKQKQLERVTLQTITTIANIIDAKDEYTKGHSYRVAEYSSMLARELGYSEERIEDIKFIGLLHDIGKIGIPDSILNKPGRLTENEFAMMRKHAEIGGNILEGNNMIAGLDEGAKFHHERYDGSGYPQGLKGEEIPEIARIIGIADAYDAMTSNRVYRKRLTDETVMSEIKRSSGTQFDPGFTAVFIKMIEEGRLERLVPDEINDEREKSRAEQSAELLQNIIDFRGDEYDSDHDYLTGAYSRTVGEKKISEILENADGGLFIADLTNLQGINARHGIVAGDRVIRAVFDALSETEGLVVVRYDGSGFLCFMPGITEREEFDKKMGDICSGVGGILENMTECENNYLCIGGALSSEVGRDFHMLLIAADKALFHTKQLKGNASYLFDHLEKMPNQGLYGIDLGQLISMIRSDSDEAKGLLEEDSAEFSRVYDLVKGIYEDNSGDVRLLLLTVMPAVGRSSTVADRDEAMSYLETVINSTPEISCVTFRFTSVQFLMILTDIGEAGAEAIRERIFNGFYKTYTKNNMALSSEIAYLPPSRRK